MEKKRQRREAEDRFWRGRAIALGFSVGIGMAAAMRASSALAQPVPSQTAQPQAVQATVEEPAGTRTELLLPPEGEIPEEVLRTRLILEGRSPLDGQLLAPEDYAALEQQLRQSQAGALPVNSELQSLVFQLKLLNLLKTVFPFF